MDGDTTGFTTQIQRCYPALMAMAHAIMMDEHAAEDAAQEAVAEACRRPRTLRKYTKLAGAAIVIPVVRSFLFPGGNGIVPESVALADVQKAFEEHETVRATGVRNCFFGDDETPAHVLPVEKSYSIHRGYADRTYNAKGELVMHLAYHLPTRTVTVMFPTTKKYYRMQAPPDYRDQVQPVTLEKSFKWIGGSGNYRQIGPKQVRGIEAVGFEINDVAIRWLGDLGVNPTISNFFLSVRLLNTRLWADPKRRLPIQAEGESEVNPCLVTGYRKMRLTEINDVWEYDVVSDESLFNPEIPEDYESIGLPSALHAGPAHVLASVPIVLVAASGWRRWRT